MIGVENVALSRQSVKYPVKRISPSLRCCLESLGRLRGGHMLLPTSRRQFLHGATAGAACLTVSPLTLTGKDKDTKKEAPRVPPHSFTAISGTPHERGKVYGQKFKDGIHTFLNR